MADAIKELPVRDKATREPVVKTENIDPFIELEECEPIVKRKKIEACVKLKLTEPVVKGEKNEQYGDRSVLCPYTEEIENKTKEEEDEPNVKSEDDVILGFYVEVEETPELYLKAECVENNCEMLVNNIVKSESKRSDERIDVDKRVETQDAASHNVATQKLPETHQADDLTCGDCGKQFRRKYELTEHYRVHTGVKTFRCSECGKWFSRRNALARHVATHIQNRFECQCCGRGFNTEQDMVKHMMVQVGIQNFWCSKCDRRFTRKDQLDQHRVLHHKCT